MPTLLGRAICCCTTGIPGFRLKIPDPLIECSESNPKCNRKIAGTPRPNDVDLMRGVDASARPQPALAPKPLDAWFFPSCRHWVHLPLPSWLGSLSMHGVPAYKGRSLVRMCRVGPICGSGLQGGYAAGRSRDGDHTAGHTSGHNQMELHSRWHRRTNMPMSQCGDKTSRRVMSECGSYVTSVSSLSTSKVLQLQLAISALPLTRFR